MFWKLWRNANSAFESQKMREQNLGIKKKSRLSSAASQIPETDPVARGLATFTWEGQ